MTAKIDRIGPERHLAIVRPRQRKRKNTAYLTREQILHIHRLVQAGYPVIQLANQGWATWGYSTPETARECIYRALRREGLPAGRETCSACGIHIDDRTRGCETCTNRHGRRHQHKSRRPYKMIGRSYPGRCVGCGCLADERTVGCERCKWRHQKRKMAAPRTRREAA